MMRTPDWEERSRLPAILVVGGLLALTFICVWKLTKQLVQDRGDISVYFNAARDLVDGRNPFVEGWYLYPVVWAWLLIPLKKLGVGPFAVIWGSFLGICWAASYVLIRRLFPELRNHARSIALLALPHVILFRWMWNGWGNGQVTLLLLVLLLVVLVLLERNRATLAGVLVAFAGVVKIFPLYFGLLFCRPLKLRAVIVVPIAAAVLFLLPSLDMGMERFWDLTHYQFFGKTAESINERLLWWQNHSPVPRLLRDLGGASAPAISKAMVVWFAVCTLVTIGLYRRDRETSEGKLWVALLFTSMVVTSPIAWGHYATFLLYPIAAMLAFICSRPDGDRHRVRMIGTLIFVAIALNAESSLFHGTDAHKGAGLVSCGLAMMWLVLAVTLFQLRADSPVDRA